jgi:catechol 2,3-dioxygenase-like lactoylglutathione lyase family enzyme
MKTHLSLPTRRIDESVAFYQSLLNAQPLKHFDDYALFVTEEPGLELSLDLDERGERQGLGPAHYGIAVDKPEAVDDAIARLKNAGHPIEIERDQTCCYARQDKVWASDPEGRRWEIYFVREESEARDGATCCSQGDGETTCCGDAVTL